MKAFICDRCGMYFTNNDKLKHKPSAMLSLFNREERQFFTADLCDKCYTDLEKWVDEPKDNELPFE